MDSLKIFRKLFFTLLILFFLFTISACVFPFSTTQSDSTQNDSTTNNTTTPNGYVHINEITEEKTNYNIYGLVVFVSPNSVILQDETGFIEYYSETQSNLTVGDYVDVSGITELSNSVIRFSKNTTYFLLEKRNVSLEAKEYDNTLNTNDFKIEYVKLSGTISAKDKSYLLLDDSLYKIQLNNDLYKDNGKKASVKGFLVSYHDYIINMLVESYEAYEGDEFNSYVELTTINNEYRIKGSVVYKYDDFYYVKDNGFYFLIKSRADYQIGDNLILKGILKSNSVKYLEISESSIESNSPINETVSEIDSSYLLNYDCEFTKQVSFVGYVDSLGNLTLDNYEIKLMYSILDVTNAKLNVKGYFIGYNGGYLFILTSFEIIEEYSTINEAVNGTVGNSYSVKGTIIAISSISLIVSDETNSIYIYLGQSHSYTAGDVIVVSGALSEYYGNLQFNNQAEITLLYHTAYSDPTPSYYSNLDITNYMNNKQIGIFVCVKGVYQITTSGTKTYRNVIIDECAYNIGIVTPIDSDYVDGYNGENVFVYGYLVGGNTSYCNMIITKLEVYTTTENNFSAVLPESWTNVQAVYYTKADGNVATSMTKNQEGIWTVELPQSALYVYFKSVSYKTETYRVDFDNPCFIAKDENYDGIYSGYFISNTTAKDNLVKLSVLSINDLHGYINASGKTIANLAYLIDCIKNETSDDDTILIGNGDLFQGTALSNLSYGQAVLDCLSAMEFDMMGIGNHEFDWGIDKIFNYFDGDSTNGEASFKLVNSNVSKNGSIVTKENICDSLIIEKMGVKVGILSYIEPECYSSILQPLVNDYSFLDIISSVTTKGRQLKDAGVDVLIVNVHGGYTTNNYNFYDILDYSVNQSLASLKYGDGYLVDAVINGHTHSLQYGSISRDGVDMAVVQAGGNNNYLGNIDIYVDPVTKKVIFSTASTYQTYTNYENEDVRLILDQYIDEYDPILNEVCGVAGETCTSRDDLTTWVANTMLNATGAQFAIGNVAGLRAANFVANKNITYANLYEIIPFDNYLVVCTMTGDQIYRFASKSSLYYSFDENSISSFSSLSGSSTVYTVVVIEYVYYWNDFPVSNGTTTNLIQREVMVADVRAKYSKGEKLYPSSNPYSALDNQLEALSLPEVALFNSKEYLFIREY